MDGLLRCSRYSFGPNRFHYCGPDANTEIRDYINDSASDGGLENLLSKFKTLYPYLRFIAGANGIRDPFDPRVVEAYWLGNRLIESVEHEKFHRLLSDEHNLQKKLGNAEFRELGEKVARGGLPHHSFHVFNIWRRTGNIDVAHTLESMNECRISAGKVVAVNGPNITVSYEPLLYENNKLALGAPIERIITRQLEAEYDIEQIRPGNIVSIHWGVPCEVITKRQAATLRKYTMQSIALANMQANR